MPAPLHHVPRLAAVVALLLALGGLAGAAPAGARSPRAVLAFLPTGGDDNPDPVFDRLDARPRLALGLVSATQGAYSPQQMMLDITAGSRTSQSVYHPHFPPFLQLIVGGDGTGFIFGWNKALDRAQTAPAEIDPGMLAGQVPGGVAYAGVKGRRNLEAVAAADPAGNVASVSLGTVATLAARVRRLLGRHRLVVAGLPTADNGDRVLDELIRDHRPGDLLLILQSPPRAFVPQLLPAAALLPSGHGGMLRSETTRLSGIVAGIDLPVTILHALALPVPKGVKGEVIDAGGVRDGDGLTTTAARLRVISGRRSPAAFALLFTWAALTLLLGLVGDRRGIRTAMRVGGLAFLWALPLLLLTGWLAPSRLHEVAILDGGAFVLGALTDRLMRWPRGPLIPATVAIVAYGTDLAYGSPLIIRSLLGVNPRSGSRFYGLGNELEATLTVLLLVALGAALMRRADFEGEPAPFGKGPGRSRRNAAIVALAGAVAAVFVGAGQLGADVGGVITVGGGIATMTLLMLPGSPSRRAIVLGLLTPVAAIACLALLDLATGGDGHFTRTILQADSAQALWDVVERRYTLAFNVLGTGAMPFLTVLAVLGVAYAARFRERVYAPLRGSPSWRAALGGGLMASIVGALFNDSGPVLLVFGIFVLVCVTAYVRGDPAAGNEAR